MNDSIAFIGGGNMARSLIGGLVAQGVVVLHMEGDRVTFEEHVPLDARVRDVKVGPDGAVYAVTEGGDASTIVRLSRS